LKKRRKNSEEESERRTSHKREDLAGPFYRKKMASSRSEKA